MRILLKMIGAAIFLAALSASIAAILSYVPVSERSSDTYYFSFLESLIWVFFIVAPFSVGIVVVFTLCFWLMQKFTRMKMLISTAISLLISIGVIIGIPYMLIEKEETDRMYLLPEGYEGEVYVFYNIKGAPEIKVEEGFDVHSINEEGYAVTSNPELSGGTVTDKYFYVHEEGNRTRISNDCVSPFGMSGFEGEVNGQEIKVSSTGFEITHENCGEEFKINGGQKDDRTYKMDLWEVIEKYYGVENEYFSKDE
ncbi:DUF6843 domain-containing protein [Halobacillus mangrovi]|uniref:DUF6843 domain-containing protein n=1 Tax=Halobacillus mangrovi TaxID=402384 RepID=A0A1W5ZWV4_9BACI|nr:hypothetical protein [Halobacillus mangrovi]ARI77816.1 hypothetical protein HM131_13580 [Halobacillus mangrovi]